MAKAKAGPALLQGQPVAYWLERIMDKDGAVAQQARAALASTVRLSAAERARFAPDAPVLLAALGGPGFNIPYYAERCLNGLGAVELPALPAFFQTLKSNHSFSLPLANALVTLAEQHPQIYVPVINHYLFDVFYGVPPLEKVAYAAQHRGKEAASLAPHLAAGLAASDGEARAVAAALGVLGDGVPALIKALRHRDEQTCQAAAASLGRIQDATAVPALTEALSQKDYTTVAAAAKALGQFGVQAASAAPALQQALASRSKVVRAAAKAALACIPTDGPAPAPAKVKVAARMAKPAADGAALLQTILDNADDDAPRLIYADWLEEHGQQERAEFIRVQIALASLTEGGAAWAELAARQDALWKEYADVWRKEAPAWAVKYGVFRRGFLDETAASAKDFIKGAAGLFSRTPVQTLNVRNCDGQHAALFACPQLTRIRTLGVSLDPTTAALLAQCPHLANLTKLDLQPAVIRDEGLQALAASPHFRKLTTVHLNGNGLTAVGVAALAQSKVFASVEHLVLGYNQNVADVGLTALARSRLLRKLTDLRFWTSNIGPAGAQALARSPLLSQLHALDLNGNHLGPAGTAAIAQSPHATALRELHLSNNALGDTGAQALAESPYLKNLTELTLYTNGITPAGIIALARSTQLTALTKLNLRYNQLSEDAAQALAESPLPLRRVECDDFQLATKVQTALNERYQK